MTKPLFGGHCQCGAVKYTVSRNPNWCGSCHCEQCRRHVSSAFATFIGCDADSVTIEEGELTHYASSPGVKRSFCRDCGTPMAFQSEQMPGEIHLLIGTLDDPSRFEPQVEVFCKEKLPWLKLEVNGPSFDNLPDL
jgi:hypothetical protein